MKPEGVHVSFASDSLPFIAPRTSKKLNSFLIFIFSSPYRLLQNHQGDHIYEQIDNLYTVFIQSAERRRHLQRLIRLAKALFFDVKCDVA